MSLYDLKQYAKKKSEENQTVATGYQMWLSYLTPFNFIFVTGAAILSLLAGSSLLTNNSILTEMQAGIFALVSGCLTIIHRTLNCDKHQAECRKLRGSYESISGQFLSLEIESDKDKIQEKIENLSSQISFITENFEAKPPAWVVNKARQQASDRLH